MRISSCLANDPRSNVDNFLGLVRNRSNSGIDPAHAYNQARAGVRSCADGRRHAHDILLIYTPSMLALLVRDSDSALAGAQDLNPHSVC